MSGVQGTRLVSRNSVKSRLFVGIDSSIDILSESRANTDRNTSTDTVSLSSSGGKMLQVVSLALQDSRNLVHVIDKSVQKGDIVDNFKE